MLKKILVVRFSSFGDIIQAMGLTSSLKNKYPNKPIVLLAFDESEIKQITQKQKTYFDDIFIWGGDSSVFPAIIKLVEDIISEWI